MKSPAVPIGQKELFAALAKAQADCAGTEKKSRNDHHRYKYASAEDMIDAATQAMAPHGLALILISSEPDDVKAPRSMTVRYLMTHAGGGSMALGPYSLTVHPDKGRPMDKAITTCLTYLQAYCIRGILNVPRVEEGTERDGNDDKMIQAYASQEQKDREKKEKEKRDKHAKQKKLLGEKKRRIKTGCEDFFKAANCNRDQETMRAFICYAAATDDYPTDYDEEIAALDETMAYLIGWDADETVEAERMAHEFSIVINGTPDHDKKAEDAFEKSLESEG